ncbi:hypothetical protein OR1_03430 [Geobacter sp. OR-1]|uniref:heavy-metal-associated domain-containing protein n=1 Tax=Geobacter sp. OR-1 TaxID=1266765 RepID=UPI0005431881|nr:heavy-metal-associated domain-containing protein [Geobacter sp. OR-1]GAM11121.1 hypothetical protein OR1_03430 [Geobacter sp. OR-1]
MNLKTISTSILVIAAVTLLVVLALRVRVGATADSVAVLRTAGMTCGSCSDRIAKALEREQGVAVTKVDITGGWVIIGFDSKRVAPETLAAKVTATGFASNLDSVLSPEEFKKTTGMEIGNCAAKATSCCAGNGRGCNMNGENQAKGE